MTTESTKNPIMGGRRYISPMLEVNPILIGDSFATSLNVTNEKYTFDNEFNWK